MKKRKIIILILVILVILYLVGTAISFVKFSSWNPIKTVIGLYQVLFTDTPYIEIQKNPKVMLCKSGENGNLTLDLKNQGIVELKDAQMGASHLFTDGENKYYKIKIN